MAIMNSRPLGWNMNRGNRSTGQLFNTSMLAWSVPTSSFNAPPPVFVINGVTGELFTTQTPGVSGYSADPRYGRNRIVNKLNTTAITD